MLSRRGVADLQERQPQAPGDGRAAPHEGQGARHHPQGHAAQPHGAQNLEELLVRQELGPEQDHLPRPRVVERLAQRLEVYPRLIAVNLAREGVGARDALHHLAHPGAVVLPAYQHDGRLPDTAAVDPLHALLVQEPHGPGAQEGDQRGGQDPAEPETGPRVDRRPQGHQPGPREGSPDQGPRVAPAVRPVVEAEDGEDADPGREQERRQVRDLRPAAREVRRAEQTEGESHRVRTRQHEDAQEAPQGLEAQQHLRGVPEKAHGGRQRQYTAPGRRFRRGPEPPIGAEIAKLIDS